MKVPTEVLERLRKYPQHFPLPLEPMHGWRSSPDEGGHTHCESCCATIFWGDPVVGRYLKYVSVVFCPECVRDNPELFREWLASRPGCAAGAEPGAAAGGGGRVGSGTS